MKTTFSGSTRYLRATCIYHAGNVRDLVKDDFWTNQDFHIRDELRSNHAL